MVFPCFSIGDVVQDDKNGQPSDDYYVTANSKFDTVSTPTTSHNRRSSQNLISSTLRAFTLAELNAATKFFDESSKIGQGGFGSVHKGLVKSLKRPYNDIHVAVKRAKKGQQGHNRQWETEVTVLGEIRHPNLVKLIGYCNEDAGSESNWLLVYEYMPNGSLHDHLSAKSNKPLLSWTRRLKIAQDAAIGLTYLHEGLTHEGLLRQIVFRDFKPSNILLDAQMNAKLSDFGFARDVPQDGRTHLSTMVVGTKGYAAPEYVQTGRLTSKIDVWSYGIFLEELITGRRPQTRDNSENNPQFLRWVCCYAGTEKSNLKVDPRLEGTYCEKSMQMVMSIADKCLLRDPKSRPKMSEVLVMVKDALALENQQIPNGGQTR